MTAQNRLLVCSCEKNMPLDGAALEKGCGAFTRADQLCGSQLDLVKAALADGTPLLMERTRPPSIEPRTARALGRDPVAGKLV